MSFRNLLLARLEEGSLIRMGDLLTVTAMINFKTQFLTDKKNIAGAIFRKKRQSNSIKTVQNFVVKRAKIKD